MHQQHTRLLQVLVHGAALMPLALMIWDYFHNQLTVNPIQEITSRTGRYALVLLLLSLACTPINLLFGLKQIVRWRRPLGLYAFVYASLHFLTFIGLDYTFNLTLILEVLVEKRYIIAGFSAFCLLIPLAITSTKAWQRRMGKLWKQLHRLVYVAALLAIVHFVWLVKSDIQEPLLYGAVLVLLLALRLPQIRFALERWRRRPRRVAETANSKNPIS